jgi:hypothetical protein
MDPSIYATWAPSQVSEEQRAGPSNEEWARDRTSQHQMGQQTHHQQQSPQQHQHAQQPQQAPLASPTLLNPSIMSDFTTLEDLGGAFDTVCGLVVPWPCGRVVTLPRAWLELCGLRYPFLFHSRSKYILSQPVLCSIHQPHILFAFQHSGLRATLATQPYPNFELLHIERRDDEHFHIPDPAAVATSTSAESAASYTTPAATAAADTARPLTNAVTPVKSYDDRVSPILLYFTFC